VTIINGFFMYIIDIKYFLLDSCLESLSVVIYAQDDLWSELIIFLYIFFK
jgi:hypothetical protein